MPAELKSDARALIAWYRTIRRDLPWRINRDPYRIWVSEVMLQQTTVAAVIPFYERFLKRFPTLHSLAEARLEEVIAHWAGLGYYSRARNLHKAALVLVERGAFPRTWAELVALPGFGPYTARAVASLAFDEKTGVLDGNVIRLLSRRHGESVEWWKPRGRERLQSLADALAQHGDAPADLNQGLMELGATVCTPKNPACLICPWASRCQARLENRVDELPLKRPRREREIWIWKPAVIVKRGQVALVTNTYAPFLKGQWITPGQVCRVTRAPKRFDYRHAITHHDIFVIIDSADDPLSALKSYARDQVKWVARGQLSEWVPATLVRRAIEHARTPRTSGRTSSREKYLVKNKE